MSVAARRCTSCSRGASRTSASGSAGCASCRPRSRSGACRSSPLLGRRLGGPLVGLVAAALVAPSWLFLFHGVYGRMYSLFLFLSLACTLALLRALERGGRGRWAVWVAASLAIVAAHPYGVLLLAGQAVYVLVARRDRLREASPPAPPCSSLGIPFWLTDLVLAGRFDVGVGGGGEKLGGPAPSRATSGARRAMPPPAGGRCARRRARWPRSASCSCAARRARSSCASSARPSRRSSSQGSAARRRRSRGT